MTPELCESSPIPTLHNSRSDSSTSSVESEFPQMIANFAAKCLDSYRHFAVFSAKPTCGFRKIRKAARPNLFRSLLAMFNRKLACGSTPTPEFFVQPQSSR